MFRPPYNLLIVLAMTRAFRQYPICRGPWTKVVRSPAPITQAWNTLQLAIYELQYVLQDIIVNKIISNKQLILVFLLNFSVALAQTQMVSQLPQPWPPPVEMAP
jgi:hypothetical protein